MAGRKFKNAARLAEAFGEFLRDGRGATSIEYAVIAAGISIAIISAVTAIGVSIRTDFYEPLADKIGGG